MATKPATLPRWARTGGGVDATNISTPSSGEQDTGYTVSQNPVSSAKTNWLFNWMYKWAFWLNDQPDFLPATSGNHGLTSTGATSATTGGNGANATGGAGTTNGNGGNGLVATGGAGAGAGVGGAGVVSTGSGAGAGAQGTGGASGPGLIAIAGGGGSPVRGALALTSQTTPSTPSNGDMWFDGSGVFSRIGGVTKRVGPQKGSLFWSGACGQTVSTNYFGNLGPWSNQTWNTTVTHLSQYKFPYAIRITNMHIAFSAGGPTGGNEVFQPYINGAATGNTFTITAGAGAQVNGVDTAQNIAVPAGQTLNILQTTSANITLPNNVLVQFDYEVE